MNSMLKGVYTIELPEYQEFIDDCQSIKVDAMTNEHGYTEVVYYKKPDFKWFEYVHDEDSSVMFYTDAALRLYKRYRDAIIQRHTDKVDELIEDTKNRYNAAYGYR